MTKVNPFKDIDSLSSLNQFLEDKKIGIGNFGGRRIQSKTNEQLVKLTLKDLYRKFEKISENAKSLDDFINIQSISNKIKILQNEQGEPKRVLLTKIKQLFGNLNFKEEKREHILKNAVNNAENIILKNPEKSRKNAKERLNKIENEIKQLCTQKEEPPAQTTLFRPSTPSSKFKKANIVNSLNEIRSEGINSNQDNKIDRLRNERTQLNNLILNLDSVILNNKIETLSQNDKFVKDVEINFSEDDIKPFLVFIEETTTKHFGVESPKADDLIPTYEAAFKALTKGNQDLYKKIIQSASNSKQEELAGHLYAIGLAKAKIELLTK